LRAASAHQAPNTNSNCGQRIEGPHAVRIGGEISRNARSPHRAVPSVSVTSLSISSATRSAAGTASARCSGSTSMLTDRLRQQRLHDSDIRLPGKSMIPFLQCEQVLETGRDMRFRPGRS
jgi:hypothetical protein